MTISIMHHLKQRGAMCRMCRVGHAPGKHVKSRGGKAKPKIGMDVTNPESVGIAQRKKRKAAAKGASSKRKRGGYPGGGATNSYLGPGNERGSTRAFAPGITSPNPDRKGKKGRKRRQSLLQQMRHKRPGSGEAAKLFKDNLKKKAAMRKRHK